MFRLISSTAKHLSTSALTASNLLSQSSPKLYVSIQKNFSSLLTPIKASLQPQLTTSLVGNPLKELALINNQNNINYVQTRTVTKYSMRKGKRKTVKTVLRRFYRLNWGIWIRTYAGRHKRLWRKSPPRRRRLRQHIFTNATQSRLLDKMVNAYWRRPKYYVDDPYEPYHTREEFQFTYKKPRPYCPPE